MNEYQNLSDVTKIAQNLQTSMMMETADLRQSSDLIALFYGQ